MVNAKKLLNFFSKFDSCSKFAVGVAQLAEHQVVALVAAGSNPVTHPIHPFFNIVVRIGLFIETIRSKTDIQGTGTKNPGP